MMSALCTVACVQRRMLVKQIAIHAAAAERQVAHTIGGVAIRALAPQPVPGLVGAACPMPSQHSCPTGVCELVCVKQPLWFVLFLDFFRCRQTWVGCTTHTWMNLQCCATDVCDNKIVIDEAVPRLLGVAYATTSLRHWPCP